MEDSRQLANVSTLLDLFLVSVLTRFGTESSNKVLNSLYYRKCQFIEVCASLNLSSTIVMSIGINCRSQAMHNRNILTDIAGCIRTLLGLTGSTVDISRSFRFGYKL